jgi:hypothetical protein
VTDRCQVPTLVLESPEMSTQGEEKGFGSSSTYSRIVSATFPPAPPPLYNKAVVQSNSSSFEPSAMPHSLDVPPPPTSRSRIPRVKLEQPSITPIMAGHLASSLIGHILFLKNQIPLCVYLHPINFLLHQ